MISKFNLTKLAILLTWFFCITIFSQVKLPKLISDGMVLQRDASVKIWGWAASSEKISIRFIDSTYNTTADIKGDWGIILSNLKTGGPFNMKIDASNSITISDIMVGDVWVCSGQSNMGLQMERVRPLYENEIANSENKYTRQFLVPQKYNFNKPQEDCTTGSWVVATPENILNFSAVSYFFGKELYEKYKVPVGLINSSLGGSPAESWISEDALKEFPAYYNEAQLFKDSSLIKQIEDKDNKRISDWYTLLWQKDEGYKNKQDLWYSTFFNTSGWTNMNIPGYWTETNIGTVNGVVWFRKKIHIPQSMAGIKAKLILGRIVDADSVFINGQFVGTTSYQYPPRRYNIPAGLLKSGENSIVIRVISNSGNGGFVPDKQYAIISRGTAIDLRGEWQYHLGAKMQPLASQTFIRWKPLGLYNAMIAPLLNYRIKGVIWYQGESNTERPVEYRKLFPALIRNWRKNWNQDDFPFLFVQLPNFMEAKSQPSESNWALLREAQSQTLSLPNTGMAVTIDLGEWNDIHPLNKKDVGKRLELAAEKVAYGDENVVYSGPVYKSFSVDGNKIIITFTNTGSGLITKNGHELISFSIAGDDKKFVWAIAKIEDNRVVVWSDKIANPIAVRYAWSDNPEDANLYNQEGLPASPFRTDDWSIIK
jgi:sialate O-acetylesterase